MIDSANANGSPSDLRNQPETAPLIYVADDRTGAGGGVQRWEFDGTSWNLAYTLSDGLGRRRAVCDGGLQRRQSRGLCGHHRRRQQPDRANLRYRGRFPGTTVALAGANQTFRGLRLGPLVTTNTTRPTLSETRGAGTVILNWGGSFFLQSAPNRDGSLRGCDQRHPALHQQQVPRARISSVCANRPWYPVSRRTLGWWQESGRSDHPGLRADSEANTCAIPRPLPSHSGNIFLAGVELQSIAASKLCGLSNTE